jgi:serine protease Do
MTLPPLRSTAGWLIIGCLMVTSLVAGPNEPVVPQVFHQDFRSGDYDPEVLFPAGQAEIFRDAKGLAMSFPAGEAKARQDTSLSPFFSLRGDFEVTVSFEILQAERPKTGDGVGVSLFIGNQPKYYASAAVALAHRLLPDGKTVYTADRLKRVEGKWTHQRRSFPTTASAGKLRLERRGTLIRFGVSEGAAAEFSTLFQMEWDRADMHGINVTASTDGSASGLELRLRDLTVRAESLPGLSDPANATALKRLDADQLGELEAKVQKLYAQLALSVVHVPSPKRSEGGFSGVITSSAGEILTCAHHDLPPQTKVTVELADGRKVKATVLGRIQQEVSAVSRFPGGDVGLLLLDEKGPWPAVPLAPAGARQSGELCLALGKPNVYHPGQPPLLRLGRLLAPHPLGMIRSSCRIQPGDSGGPLFDLEGRVLGVHQAMESLTRGINMHAPVEVFLSLRERLRESEVIALEQDRPAQPPHWKDRAGAWEPTPELSKVLNAANPSTVEVLGDGQPIALGLVVEDGQVLTKRSALTGPRGPRRLVCRWSDGRELQARLRGESRAHDLALLHVPAAGLPVVRWGKSSEIRVGQLLASPGPGPQPLHYGSVAAVHVKNPSTKSYLPISVGPAPEGLRGAAFTGFLPAHRQIDEARGLLQPGDLLTHLDEVPTLSKEEFVRVRDQRIATPNTFAGEWIKLTIDRDGKARQVFLPLVDGPAPFPAVWQQTRWNVRRNGFPDVFCHDGGLAHNRCGGPVVDRSGQVIGVNIARADPLQTFAIPSEVVQHVIVELKAQAPR